MLVGGMNIHDVYGPFLTHFRRRRIDLLVRTLELDARTRILDVGGSAIFWKQLETWFPSAMPRITILNVSAAPANLPPYIGWVQADGCRLPFRDQAFDLAFSNSVIEHVGNLDFQQTFASEIRRVARRYWVQTPDPRFLIEPHYIAPFLHWLPKGARRMLLRRCSVWGWVARPTRQDIEKIVAEIRLVRPREFRHMFPDARILVERLAGLPKSLIAVRV